MMMLSFHRLIQDNKGATLVEFALVAPVLIMFVFGVLQIGMAMQANGALREVIGWGGREAMVSYQDTSDGVYSDTAVADMIKAKASDGAHRLEDDKLTVTVTSADDNTLLVKKITVVASYDLDFAIPLWDAKVMTLTQNRVFYVPL